MKLEVVLARERFVLDNLDPVTIRVQQKSDVLHPSISEPLLESGLLNLKLRARCLEVVHRDT
jgi:hypothetical protein